MSLWSWIKSWFVRPPAEEDGGPMVSLVLLLAKPCRLDAGRLTRVVNRALDLDLETDNPEATEFVTGDSPLFMLKLHEDWMFCINNFAKSYFDEDPSEDIAELRLRKSVSEHRAWLSVDRIGDRPDDGEAYRIIGRVIAAVADRLKTPPVVLNPTTGGLVYYGDEVGEALRGDDPLEAFVGWHGPVPVVPVRGDDPRMLKAIEEAQHRWPEFVQAFENRGDDDAMFAVKAGVREGDEEEFMWMDVTGMEAGIIYGKLENVPVALKKIKLGDTVRIREDEVIDWLYRREDEDDAAGGFTVKAIEEIQRDGEAE